MSTTPRLESKLPDVGTTIFTIMSQMAADHKAINLSQGYPDYDGPRELTERLAYFTTHGYNQYAPLAGVPVLRQQVAAKVARFYDHAIDADSQITITPGATEAIFCAVHAVIRPGDEVIMFDPVYDCYDPAVRLAGGVPVPVRQRRPVRRDCGGWPLAVAHRNYASAEVQRVWNRLTELTSGRSSVVRIPGAAATTAGIALTIRAAAPEMAAWL